MPYISSQVGTATTGESAQDVTCRWLKRHIASLPRHVGTFLTEAEVAAAAQTRDEVRAAEALAAHLHSTLVALRLPDTAETMERSLRVPPPVT